MKFLIELDKTKNNVTEIYRKVLSKKAQAVQIVDDQEKAVTIEVWFADKDFFEAMVSLVVDIDFSKVVMINNGDEEPTENSDQEDDDLVENKPPENGIVPVEGGGGGEGIPKAAGPPVEEKTPIGGDVPEGGGILIEEGPPVEETGPVEGFVPKAGKPVEGEALTGDELLKAAAAAAAAANEVPVGGDVLKTGGADEATGGAEGEEKKPKAAKKESGTGKGSRKREGKDLTDLLEIPDFPKEFILDKVIDFFRPMKDTVVEPLRTVLMIALDQNKDCTMEWKDLVAVASEMGIHLSDFDKVKYSKQIADVFERHGYSVRAKSFLKLLRGYVDGTIKVPEVKMAEEKKPEPAPAPAAEPPKKVSRFAMIPYHEGLEDLFTRVWDEGRGLDEMMVEIFAYMAGEDLNDDEVAYLTVCAERIAFDSLNDIYLDMDKSQTEVRMIQVSLSEKLNGFIEANNFKAVKLYDFLDDLREIFEREA